MRTDVKVSLNATHYETLANIRLSHSLPTYFDFLLELYLSYSIILLPSSETQGQLVGAGKSLSGREKNWGEVSFLTFLRLNFFLARLDFFPPPLTAPRSPRIFSSMHVVSSQPGLMKRYETLTLQTWPLSEHCKKLPPFTLTS